MSLNSPNGHIEKTTELPKIVKDGPIKDAPLASQDEKVMRTGKLAFCDAAYPTPNKRRKDSEITIANAQRSVRYDPPCNLGLQQSIGRSKKSQKGDQFKTSTESIFMSTNTRTLLRDLGDRNYYVNHKLNAEREALASRKVRNNRTLRNFLNML